MKIVYCTGSLYSPGGAERVLINKANYLSNVEGYEVTIITASQLDKPYCYPIDSKVRCIDANILALFPAKIIPLFTAWNVKSKIKKLYKDLLENIDPDVIVVNELGYDDEIIPSLNLRAKTIREFHSSHEAVKQMVKAKHGLAKLRTWYTNYKSTKLFNNFDAVVLLTERDAKQSNYKTHTTVIPNTLLDIQSERSGLNSKKVISVGRLDRLKNFGDQIIAWQKIKEEFPDWTLHIYGQGVEKDNLQELIKSLQLENSVFLEGVSYEISKAYLDSSIFLFTSLAEGFGMVLIEGMSCGLPCVSYDIDCGPSEIIENAKNGYLVNKGDVDQLTDALRQLMSNDALLQEMSDNALERSKDFHPEKIMPLWIHLFQYITK